MSNLSEITQAILSFRDARDWKQFHSPRNLAAALSIEASELQETILWKTDADVASVLRTRSGQKRVGAELADILISALLFADSAGIDPEKAIQKSSRRMDESIR